jgi:hypothetical protein
LFNRVRRRINVPLRRRINAPPLLPSFFIIRIIIIRIIIRIRIFIIIIYIKWLVVVVVIVVARRAWVADVEVVDAVNAPKRNSSINGISVDVKIRQVVGV